MQPEDQVLSIALRVGPVPQCEVGLLLGGGMGSFSRKKDDSVKKGVGGVRRNGKRGRK
jgi:hypothetical protein